MSMEQSSERLAGNLKSVMEGAEEVMNATAGQTEEKVRELRGRLAAALESAKTAYQRLQDGTVAAARATDKTIRHHPYESIGIAFGLGLLVGVLVARK
jgi:ElaB/YqjD/DUF883 family membrane-anchored ribosome-binding protein